MVSLWKERGRRERTCSFEAARSLDSHLQAGGCRSTLSGVVFVVVDGDETDAGGDIFLGLLLFHSS
jgi:hypothetical protein